MRDAHLLSDEEFCERMTEQIGPQTVRAAFQKRYGRGWQHQLAQNLGIADSTLSGWMKSNKIPDWARPGIGLLLLRHELSRPADWRVIERGDSYEICSFEEDAGRIVARKIKQVDDAMLIAAAPALFEACGEAWVVISDAAFEGWDDVEAKLRNALDAVKMEKVEGQINDGGKESEA